MWRCQHPRKWLRHCRAQLDLWIFAETAGEGPHVKGPKEILWTRDEQEMLLDVFLRAMDTRSSATLAEAA
jgi:hypothetical protein